MFKKAVQRGRSERGDEAYSFPYVEPLSDAITRRAGTRLADFLNILLVGDLFLRHDREDLRARLFCDHAQRCGAVLRRERDCEGLVRT